MNGGAEMGRKKKTQEVNGEIVTGSQSIRVSQDLARMVAWICEIEGLSALELVDPLIRPSITARFERIKKQIEEIEKIKQEAQTRIEKLRKRADS